MAQSFPYTYYSCDCFDSNTSISAKRASQLASDTQEERTFDPRNPRSNYTLYLLEHLLYCEDCRQIRCPRCVTEETLNWYCPSCLFEVPSSIVKSDGNRCTRNCFNCPVCTSPLMVNILEQGDASTGDKHILSCPYCHWTTIETGVEFDKPTGVHAQLARKDNGGRTLPTNKERDKERERRRELSDRQRVSGNVALENDEVEEHKDVTSPSLEESFLNLSAFYKSQLASQTPPSLFSPHDINLSSPSAYSRILSLYSTNSAKRQKPAKTIPMRETAYDFEGLQIFDSASDVAKIERIKRDGWSSTLSPTQKRAQINPYVQFDTDLRPVPTLLCTKRSKRCRSCRHILSKPESKITSTRYKIKLLALNHIPRISVRALPASTTPTISAQPFSMSLRPGTPTHFLIHLSNPLFDPVRVTLATPSVTPGKIQSRVTILCPQFEIGANTDVWDDALSSSASLSSTGGRVGQTSAEGQLEAGKVWDKGRNWTLVAVEVVPGFLKSTAPMNFSAPRKGEENGDLCEDEDILEIPVFVRIEFESEMGAEERGPLDTKSKGEKEKREEAFWTVVGVGRIVA